MRPVLEAHHVDLDTPEGRPLLRDLTMSVGHDRVAIVGRNGVGKSTLLQVLAGVRDPDAGIVRAHGSVGWVPQQLVVEGCSHGEARRRALDRAFGARPELLLLDEPTEDLDHDARIALLDRVRSWRHGLIVVSHDPELLEAFEHFFVMSESGCRYVPGSFAELQVRLADEAAREQERYDRHLQVWVGDEEKHRRVAQRRRRKKAVGRLHELDRSQSRMRLNQRRSTAQVSQGRVAGMAESRIEARRAWARASRRALAVELPLELTPLPLPEPDGPSITLTEARLARGTRDVVPPITLAVGRERVGLVGPNGSGKTTLLALATGGIPPTSGRVRVRHERVGSIAQGAADWCTSESLVEALARVSDTADLDVLAERIVQQRFPLALALRPLASLSPGERTRAALIVLFQRPGLEVLVLDEPTFSLDLVGVRALTLALRGWKGGLLVASHDPRFLGDLGLDRLLEVGGDIGMEAALR
ncbi:MAG: ATP-binding cassette domain-containing protein [Myxococcota bacterium]